MAKRYIPRWLYCQSLVWGADPFPIGGIAPWIKIPPGILRNDTIWPMQLEYLVVAGPTIIDAAPPGNAIEGYAGIGDQLFAELGISQEGDINIVPAQLNGVFSPTEPARLQSSIYSFATTCHFRYPYRLSRDSGFIAHARGIETAALGNADLNYPGTWPSSVMFRGVDIVDQKPVILAASSAPYIPYQQGDTLFDAADLMNMGTHDVDIYSMTVVTELGIEGAGGGVSDAYLVNPLLGERWMPGEQPIPQACLAPFSTQGNMPTNNVNPYTDNGPHVFSFPAGTYLHRRQEVGLRLSQSFYALNHPVHVALFGYLEVE